VTASPTLVAVSGNVRTPSRTASLVRLIQAEVESRLGTTGSFIEAVKAAPPLMAAMTRDDVGPSGSAVIRRIESADVLVIGSPIYRASYTGALKHVFDLVHNQSLIGSVAIIAATGGTPLHGLAVEHQFRPLLSYFGIVAAATTIYALESDFVGFELTSDAIRDRIARAADEAALLARSGLRQRRAAAAAA
jgi:FMN reductase